MLKAILIGPPGSGKSTVGKALAKLWECSFADTDAIIESKSGKKIADIFVEDGEPAFRILESSVVAESVNELSGVLSLGGGAILDPATQKLLGNSNSPIIFLDVAISQAAPRVGFNKERPLLLVNPRQQWLSLMEKRRPIYEELADFTLSTDNKKPAVVAQEISEMVSAHEK